MLEFFFPSLGFDQLVERVFKMESVFCSIPGSLGQAGSKKARVPFNVEQNCLQHYVIPLLRIFSHAMILAAGKNKRGTGDTERRIREFATRERFEDRLRYVYHPTGRWEASG